MAQQANYTSLSNESHLCLFVHMDVGEGTTNGWNNGLTDGSLEGLTDRQVYPRVEMRGHF